MIVQAQIRPDQLRDLNALRDVKGRSRSALIRDAIDCYLETRRHEIPAAATTTDPRQEGFNFTGMGTG